jgi:hypothetical protein
LTGSGNHFGFESRPNSEHKFAGSTHLGLEVALGISGCLGHSFIAGLIQVKSNEGVNGNSTIRIEYRAMKNRWFSKRNYALDSRLFPYVQLNDWWSVRLN